MTSEPRARRRWVIALGAVTVAGAALRFGTLDESGFTSDESVTALLIDRTFTGMVSGVRDTESTPPLYYVLAWAWAAVFGTGEFGLRALSALMGVVAIPLTFAASVLLVGSRRAALAAAAVVATSPFLVAYSQTARAYAVVVPLSALSLIAFERTRAASSVRPAAVWATVCFLSIVTHYFMAFLVLGQAVLLLRHRAPGARIGVAVVGVGAMVVLPFAVAQRRHGLADNLAAGDPLSERLVILAKQFLVGPAAPYDRVWALLVSLAFGWALFALLTRGWPALRSGAITSLFIGAVALACPIALALAGFDYVIPRNSIAAAVPIYIGAIAGVAAMTRVAAFAVPTACAVLLVTAVAVEHRWGPRRENWRGLALELAAPRSTRLIVVAPNLDEWSARVPLHLYLESAEPFGRRLAEVESPFLSLLGRERENAAVDRAVVDEIDVVGVDWPLPLADHEVPAPFQLAHSRSEDGYRLSVYRSPRPVVVSVSDLSVAAGRAAVLLQRAARSTRASAARF